MQFQFDNLSEFFNMAGHGPYVWVCYLVTFIAIGYLLIAPIRTQKKLLKSYKRQEQVAQSENSDAPASVTEAKQSW
ncbi:heme exporter protein CcmD [Sessilibacter sp. MAH4]